MRSVLQNKKEPTGSKYLRAPKVNECIAELPYTSPPAQIFDDFWRDGEVALLFGASGTGKSILAVQLAESIASGRKIGMFRMSSSRRKVLYVDLKLSGRQFGARYYTPRMEKTGARIPYRFSGNLYRFAPASPDELCGWLREQILTDHYRTIVIDDISSLRTSADGTRETLKAMRELRRMAGEFNVSILVLADAREPGRQVVPTEHDLMRSRVLCDAADSVFALARHPSFADRRFLVQIRSQYKTVWNATNAPNCWIGYSDDGLLSMMFDARFTPPLSDDRRRMICEIKRRYEAGEKLRPLASAIGISAATASRLLRKWTPDMEPPRETPPEQKPRVVDHFEGEMNDYISEIGMDANGSADRLEEEMLQELAHESDHIPSTETSQPDPFAGMKRSVDRRGSRIFIQKEDENGKPTVWYGYNKAGRFSCFERTPFGISIKPYDGLALPP